MHTGKFADLGWVVGHSYICYAPLLAGLTTILYEGKPVGTPDAGQFYRYNFLNNSYVFLNLNQRRVIDEHKVNGMFTAPTGIILIVKHLGKKIIQAQFMSNHIMRQEYQFTSLYYSIEGY